MLKKLRNLLPVLLLAIGFVTLTAQTSGEIMDYCTSSATKKKAKADLAPYKYDGSKTTRITFKYVEQRKEIEIPLYFGERYRMVFNREGSPQPVQISVYNKSHTQKNRELLWTTKDEPTTENQFVFEPKRARKMFVNYDIPATTDTIKKGCVVMLLGYAIK